MPPDALPTTSGRVRTTMGICGENSAWVRHQAGDTRTMYLVTPRETKVEYLPDDYDVVVEEGPDVLAHDEVRRCAHDAFLDAYGGF